MIDDKETKMRVAAARGMGEGNPGGAGSAKMLA